MHSDGDLTVAELARFAAAQGLDFLAVTDHNTTSHHAELKDAAARYGIILIPGQEVTTEEGHAGALGDVGWIDFREPPDRWLDTTERQGGLLSVNHPIGGHVSWIWPMQRRPPLAEVWHWSWLDPHWTTPLAWWLAWDPTAVPVGGSDWHRPGSDATPGTPTTWVECAGEEPGAVLDGLRAGRCTISARRDGPVLLRRDGEFVAVGADGTILAGPDGARAVVRGDAGRVPGGGRLSPAARLLRRHAGPHRIAPGLRWPSDRDPDRSGRRREAIAPDLLLGALAVIALEEAPHLPAPPAEVLAQHRRLVRVGHLGGRELGRRPTRNSPWPAARRLRTHWACPRGATR